jgi:hypothetical protein
MVVQKLLKDLGRVWVRGAPAFLPASDRRERDVEIIFSQDGDGFALREFVLLPPGCELSNCWVDFAASHIGGKHFPGFNLGIFSQFLKAFAFLLRIGRAVIHSLVLCDMSQQKTIFSDEHVSKGWQGGLRKSIRAGEARQVRAKNSAFWLCDRG